MNGEQSTDAVGRYAVWGGMVAVGLALAWVGFQPAIAVGVVLAAALFAAASAKLADKLGVSDPAEWDESPNECPVCDSKDLLSRPVHESTYYDRLIASMPFAYKCESCDFTGYGPGPTPEDVESELTGVFGFLERLKVWK